MTIILPCHWSIQLLSLSSYVDAAQIPGSLGCGPDSWEPGSSLFYNARTFQLKHDRHIMDVHNNIIIASNGLVNSRSRGK